MGYPNVYQYNVEAKKQGLPEISPWEHNQVFSYKGGFRNTERSRKIQLEAGIPDTIHRRGGVGYWLPGSGSSAHNPYEGFILPEMPEFKFPDFESLGFTLPDISQSRPSETGTLDAIGVRAKKSKGTSSLSNQFNLSASAMGSLKEGARKAGLNLPV